MVLICKKLVNLLQLELSLLVMLLLNASSILHAKVSRFVDTSKVKVT